MALTLIPMMAALASGTESVYRDLAAGPFIFAFITGALMFGLALRGRG